MFDHLTFPWASSTIGFIAFGLSIIPFVLILFGGWLRDRSKVCRQILKEQEEEKLRKEEQEFSKPGDKNHV